MQPIFAETAERRLSAAAVLSEVLVCLRTDLLDAEPAFVSAEVRFSALSELPEPWSLPLCLHFSEAVPETVPERVFAELV